MRTVKGPNLQDLPPGYELVRYDSATLLAMPSATAGASRAELMRRQDALDDARRKELHELQEAKSKAAAAERSEKAGQSRGQGANPLHPFGDEPAPGYYRVIPKWAEFASDRRPGQIPALGRRGRERAPCQAAGAAHRQGPRSAHRTLRQLERGHR